MGTLEPHRGVILAQLFNLIITYFYFNVIVRIANIV